MALDIDQSKVPFDEVFRQEKEQITRSREARLDNHKSEDSPVDKELVGIALSGGGVGRKIGSGSI